MDQKHLDHRAGFVCDTLVSTGMTPEEKRCQLTGFTGSEEDWGPDPFFVVNSDPSDKWKKVLIVNTDTGTATFRSITEDPCYRPKKVLRPGGDWWLDKLHDGCQHPADESLLFEPAQFAVVVSFPAGGTRHFRVHRWSDRRVSKYAGSFFYLACSMFCKSVIPCYICKTWIISNAT